MEDQFRLLRLNDEKQANPSPRKLADSDPINSNNNNNNTSSNSESQIKPPTATQSSSSFASSTPSALVDYSDSESTCSIGNELLNAESDMNDIQIYTDYELETKNFQSDLEIYNKEDLDSEIETDKNSVLNEKTENLKPFLVLLQEDVLKLSDPIQCSARIHTNLAREIVLLKNEFHLHEADDFETSNTHDKPRTTIKDCLIEMPISAASSKEAKKLSEVEINDKYKYTKSDNIRLLNSEIIWFIEGSFEVSPQPFKQLFSVNVNKINRNLPCVYGLLSNKQEETYDKYFNLLSSYLTKRPNYILCDYEIALIKSLKSSCPSAIKPIYDYFERYYIGLPTEDKPKSRLSPIFPIRTWNVSKRLVKNFA
ncbi:unnamed protein product [Brachionus calyciflorus]|uniref:MULE transposase domain-containing protein n=1 Tax=Brachionus calyciflorus TaxID=104777 RepID=A0A814QJ14_9BILA|nr:unnamed protein product [Brachionus calyciflorus]